MAPPRHGAGVQADGGRHPAPDLRRGAAGDGRGSPLGGRGRFDPTLLEPQAAPWPLWPTNYTKLACSTMFTVFFAGKTLPTPEPLGGVGGPPLPHSPPPGQQQFSDRMVIGGRSFDNPTRFCSAFPGPLAWRRPPARPSKARTRRHTCNGTI